ncbi:hypothetical protein [Streptomyces sp. Inha503]|uniref:hypothetical protein n=1 Tax=Streptomyces sp. Inha503 TaxID=3383314 RepID=UPI0039A1D22E
MGVSALVQALGGIAPVTGPAAEPSVLLGRDVDEIQDCGTRPDPSSLRVRARHFAATGQSPHLRRVSDQM